MAQGWQTHGLRSWSLKAQLNDLEAEASKARSVAQPAMECAPQPRETVEDTERVAGDEPSLASASSRAAVVSKLHACRPAVEEDDSYATSGDLDDLCSKSEALIRMVTDSQAQEEEEISSQERLISEHRAMQEKLRKIEALVVSRTGQLSQGDSELMLCQTIRALCFQGAAS